MTQLNNCDNCFYNYNKIPCNIKIKVEKEKIICGLYLKKLD